MAKFDKMTKASILYGLFYLLTAQCAIINNKDGTIKRIARSPHCGECESQGPPHPPGPPPPFFHTHQWTGVERTADGISGVFSGAAAGAAGADSSQTAGQAFSIASSSSDTSAGVAAGVAAGATSDAALIAGSKTGADTDVGRRSAQNNGVDGSRSLFRDSAHRYNGQSSGGYRRGSASLSGGSNEYSSGGSNGYRSHNGNTAGSRGGQEFKSLRESHYTYSGNKQFGERNDNIQDGNEFNFDQDGQTQSRGFGGQSNGRAQSSTYSNGKAIQTQSSRFKGQSNTNTQSSTHTDGNVGQLQSREFGNGQNNRPQSGVENIEQTQSTKFGGPSNTRAQSSSYGGENGDSSSNGYGSSFAGSRHGYHEKLSAGGEFSNKEQKQVGSESFVGNEQQLQSSGRGQWERESGSSVDVTQQANGDTQAALSGALGLASQGLQASEQAASSGCSTCGKSNYALSNAKSHSGNAIAISVGG